MHTYPSAFESPFPGALQRFVDKHEQEKDGSGDALRQILEGKKKGCWIWWILPQVAGEVLHHTGGKHDGSSESRRFALEGLREAIAFLDHSFLGKNYFACVRAIRDQVEPSGPRGGQGRTLNEIFGESDAKKVRCSVTLFRRAACWSSQLSHNSYRELVANCDAILVAASRDGHHPCEHVPKVCSSTPKRPGGRSSPPGRKVGPPVCHTPPGKTTMTSEIPENFLHCNQPDLPIEATRTGPGSSCRKTTSRSKTWGSTPRS